MNFAHRFVWTPVLLLGATALLVAQKPTPAAIEMKLGLWEVSMSVNFDGSPAMPNSAPHRSTAQKCLTKDNLSKSLFPPPDGETCRDTYVANSKTVLDVKRACTGGGTQQGTLHLESTGSTLTGTVHALSTSDGKSQKVDVALSGKWLATACGAVK